MTDVEGSTRKWETQPEAMRAAMARHDLLIEECVHGNHGVLLKQRGEGDSQFAVFESAVDALHAAIEIQAGMHKEDWLEVGQLRVRVALHTGESELRGDDYYGPAVNRCARIRASAHGGQTLLSQLTKRLIDDQLPDGVSLEDLGRHRLKDLLEPERIYQASHSALPSSFPPLRTLDEVRHNLPVQLSSFVGREDEIREVRRLVFSKRLVTLSGAGGSGKTRLALQVAAEAVDHFPDGVWFVDLTGVTDGSLVAQEIATQLKLPVDPSAGLADQFEGWRALIVLDNCEQVIRGAAGVVQGILKANPGVTVLATSREALGVAGEHLYRIPPLGFDLGTELPTVEAVSSLDATKLLLERASDRGYGESLHDDNAIWIAKLCKRLDGIPLAIEQAAANLDVLSPKQLLDKLEQHFSMRGLQDDGVPERHRTLEATIDWSYQMLGLKERFLFERLAIFAGGWSLDAARAVCQGEEIAEREVDDLLASLLKKNLVASTRSTDDGLRFRFLEAIREYALAHARKDEDLLKRHYAYFNGVAQESLVQLAGPNQSRWALLMEAEHDNLRKALKWAQDHNCSAEMAVAMRRFWMRTGFMREGLAALRFAVENETNLPPESEASAFNAMGAFAFRLEDLASAKGYYEQSLSLWKSLANLQQQAVVIHNLGLLAIQTEDTATAMQWLRESFALNTQLGQEPAAASALYSIGTLELHSGEIAAAKGSLSQACDRFRRLEDAHSLGLCLSLLGDCEWSLGNAKSGLSKLNEALDVWGDIHDPYGLCVTALCLSEIGLTQGHYRDAAVLECASRRLFERVGTAYERYLAERTERIVGSLQCILPKAEKDEIERSCRLMEFEQLRSKCLSAIRQFA